MHLSPCAPPVALTEEPISTTPWHIVGFVHISLVSGWQAIFREQLFKLQISGLYEQSTSIMVGLVGGDREEFDSADFCAPKLSVACHDPIPHAGEVATLEAVRTYCLGLEQGGRSHGAVYYLNANGVACPAEFADDWRRLAEHFLINRYQECLAALEDCDACGVNRCADPVPHFDGNSWWARSSFIAQQPSLRSITGSCSQRDWSPQATAKYWLGWHKNAQIRCLFDARVAPRCSGFPRSKYSCVHEVPPRAEFNGESAWHDLENRFQDLLDPLGEIASVVGVTPGIPADLLALASALPTARVVGIGPSAAEGCQNHSPSGIDMHLEESTAATQAKASDFLTYSADFPNLSVLQGTSTTEFKDSLDVLLLDSLCPLVELTHAFSRWAPRLRAGGCVLFQNLLKPAPSSSSLFDLLPGRKAVLQQGAGLGAWYKGDLSLVKTSDEKDGLLLSVCLIVRDAATTLSACLDSIAPWVDEIVVVDTGSLDDTRLIARRYTSKVFEFPWIDDFAAARNESLQHATGRWLLWMDADDTITPENGAKLRACATLAPLDGPMAYVIQVVCPSTGTKQEGPGQTVVDHVKLLRNLPGVRFQGRIHEQVLPSIRTLQGEIGWTDIAIHHSGSDQSEEGRQRKYERDLRILHLETAEQPQHPFTWFNLGMTYADMGQCELAIEALQRSLAYSQPGESHLRKAHAILVSCFQQQRRFDEAWTACQQGLAECPEDVELRFRAATLHHHFGRHCEAVAAYQQVLSASPERYLSSMDESLKGYKARHNLALVYMDWGRFDLAESEWRQIRHEFPTHRAAWTGLGECLIRQGKHDAALQEAERSLVHAELRGVAGLLRSSLALSIANVDMARQELAGWACQAEGDADLLRFRCQFHWQHGSPIEALAALNELIVRVPDEIANHRNLAMLLERHQCWQVAADTWRRAWQIDGQSLASRLSLIRCLIHADRPNQAYQILCALPLNEEIRAERDTLQQQLANHLRERLLRLFQARENPVGHGPAETLELPILPTTTNGGRLSPPAQESMMVSGTALVILRGATSQVDDLDRTLAVAIRYFPEILVVTPLNDPWLEHVAHQFRPQVSLRISDAQHVQQVMSDVCHHLQARWIGYCWSGEVLSPTTATGLRELVGLASPEERFAFALRIQKRDPTAGIIKAQDEPRFFHRELAPELQGSLRPHFSAAIKRGVNCCLTELAIESFGTTWQEWQANSLSMSCDPTSVHALDRYWIGIRHLAEGRPFTARRWLQAALEDVQLAALERTCVIAQLIRAHGEVGDLTAALQLYESCPRQLPRPSVLLHQIGIIHQLCNQPQQALGCFRAAIHQPATRGWTEEDPWLSSCKTPHHLALCYLQLHQFTRAEETWSEILAGSNHFAPAHAGLCELFLRQQRYSAARKRAEMMVETPDLKVAGFVQLRRVASATDCPAEASRILECGLRQYPENPSLLRELIDLHMASGELDEARVTLVAMIHLFPQETAYYRRVAEHLIRCDERPLAEIAWQACYNWEPEFEITSAAWSNFVTNGNVTNEWYRQAELKYRFEQLLLRD